MTALLAGAQGGVADIWIGRDALGDSDANCDNGGQPGDQAGDFGDCGHVETP